MLNVNEVAKGHSFCSVRNTLVSPNSKIMAYAVDTIGRRKYDVRFRDLETGKDLPDTLKKITPNFVWAEDNQTLFYTVQDPQTLRSYQVYRHQLGTQQDKDVLVYEEEDEEFRCGVRKSRSKKLILINSSQTLSSETRYLDAFNPDSELKIFLPRQENHEYSLDHFGQHFYIRTNDKAKNFRLMRTSENETAKSNWSEVLAHDPDAFFNGYELFKNWLVLQLSENGLTKLRIRSADGSSQYDVDFGEPCYQARIGNNPEPNSNLLRYTFSSLKTPNSTFATDMKSKEKTLIKQQQILGGFDTENYKTERIWANTIVGTKVPISLVYHKKTPIDGTAPCLQYGYGSYGASMSASFNPNHLNLLDRGFVYAIAHIRGGQEMGRHWYEQGKLLNKINTFTDFIACGQHLVANGYAAKNKLFAQGGSAGGLLIGAVINLAPDQYHAVIADVPFVDVVTTMLDASIPLTTSEYDEWGNPNEPEYYNYMLSYSPYDQVAPKNYPHMLVTTGLHDSQVQYWEPAKWVARLRDRKTDENMLILKTNMSAGHGGATGRYDRYKELALRQAFLLYHAGVNE